MAFAWDNARRPLGFKEENVWSVRLQLNMGEQQGSGFEAARRLRDEVKSLPEVLNAGLAMTAPYANGGMFEGREVNGRRLDFEMDPSTDEVQDVLGLKVTAGRWFSKEDEGVSWTPIVINERLRRDAFGAQDPIGKPLVTPDGKSVASASEKPMRVVGVIEEFRKGGPLAAPANFAFIKIQPDGRDADSLPRRSLLVKLRPGTPAAFEETLVKRLRAVAPQADFQVKSLHELRAASMRKRLVPILAVETIAGFLLLMVALGLTGVLWQNVTQRTREIGLRRAKGATRGAVARQIVGEVLVLAAISLSVALVLLAQLPLLKASGPVSAAVYWGSFVLSAVLMRLLTTACSLYPSRLALKRTPAEALHYE